MMDRIEHTEHKRRDREAATSRSTSFGERRSGDSAERADQEPAERPDART